MSPVDTLRDPYFVDTLYDSLAFGDTLGLGTMVMNTRKGAHWTPQCGAFANGANAAEFFVWNELKSTTADYAVFQAALLIDTSYQYGLPYWRLQYGGPRTPTSVYRQPTLNYEPVPAKPWIHGALGSEHMRGTAADLANQSGDSSEWAAMITAAALANASFIEKRTGPCGLGCAHADWRWYVYWPTPIQPQ